jgi:hypothetical protein
MTTTVPVVSMTPYSAVAKIRVKIGTVSESSSCRPTPPAP